MPRLAHPTSDRSRRRTAVAVLALSVALGSVILASCASSADRTQPVEAGSASSTTPASTASAPATSTAPAVSVGPATVVETTVSSTPTADGSWRAFGLVQNDGASAVGGLHVRATLLRTDGSAVAVIDGDSPVVAVDGHERVPFSLAASTPAVQVASVSWQAFATAGSGDAAGRDLTVSTYWTRPYGDTHRLDLPSYRDPAGGTVPFAQYASLTNGGATPVSSPTLVLAWSGPDGRVLAVASGRAVDSQGAPVDVLAAGASRDVLVLVDDATIAPGLEQLTPQTWSTGR